MTVLTGAGISTDSGIPDFRGPDGLWTKNPEAERASHIAVYTTDREVRRRNWARRAAGELWAEVEPNIGHRAVAHLAEQGKLHTVVTQNVDELHQLAGLDPALVVEVHGTTRKAKCLSCDYRTEMDVVLDRVRSGEDDPPCPECGGLLKSATVSFGENLDPVDLARAETAAEQCDLFLAVGSSLTVHPINETVAIARLHGAGLVIVNAEPTPFDGLADVVLNESISEVLPQVTGMHKSR